MNDSRTKQLKIRISEGEGNALQLLAVNHGITVSDYVRMMIDREMAAFRALMEKKVSPVEFSYQAELVRRGIAQKNGKDGKR